DIPEAPMFDTCIADDSSRNLMEINTKTGEYQFTACPLGLRISGIGAISRRGCSVILQQFSGDRRILAKIDTCSGTGTATVQLLSSGISFYVSDRNSSNTVCECALN